MSETVQRVEPMDETCQRCGSANLVWWTESEHWNLAVPERVPILCPACFAQAWEAATGLRVIWELRLDPASSALRGTKWDDEVG